MVMPLNHKESYQDDEEQRKPLSVIPTPHLTETTQQEKKPQREERFAQIELSPTIVLPSIQYDQFPTLFLPKLDIAQAKTQVGIQVVRSPLPQVDFSTQHMSISEQPTWIIPIIPASSQLGKQASEHRTEQNYSTIIRTLIKSSGIYALSSLASPLLSLLLAPFLTHYLSHTSYGVLIILNTFLALMVGVTQLGIADAFFKSYNHDAKTEHERLAVLSTLTLLLVFISIPIALLVIVASSWLATLLLNGPAFTDAVKIVALIMLVQNLSIPGLVWLRAESRALPFSALSLCNLLVSGAVTIYLVVFLHFGIIGSLLGTGSGYLVIVVGTLPIVLLRTGLQLRLNIARELLAVGTPHVINLLSGWVLQLSDRYLLGHLGSFSLAASYAVAYSLGGVLSAVVITPFSMAWWVIIYSIAKQENATYIFRLIFRWFSMLLVFAAFGLSLAGISILNILFPPAYSSAAPIIPVIALSIMFSGIYVVFSLGVSLYGKTWITSIAVTIAAILNVVSNLLLIPHFGAMGAAIATLLSYVLLVILAYFVNRRLYPVPFEIKLFGFALLLGVGMYAGGDFLARGQHPLVAYGIHAGILLFYGGLLLLLLISSRNKHLKAG